MAMRASSLTAENKRRTLQRNDIAMAVAKTDTYDFLIDIVPRDEVRRCARGRGGGGNTLRRSCAVRVVLMGWVEAGVYSVTSRPCLSTCPWKSCVSMPGFATPFLLRQPTGF